MIENAMLMRCGGCSEAKMVIYKVVDPKNGSWHLVAECTLCKSQTFITVTEPQLNMDHWTGDGGLAVF